MASHAELTSYINSLAPIAYWTMSEASGTFAQTGSSTAAALTPTGTILYRNRELIPGDTTKFATFTAGSYANGSRGNITVPSSTLSASALVYFVPPVDSGVGQLRVLQIGASGETEATNYQLMAHLRSDGRLADLHESGAGVNTDMITDKSIDPRYTIGSGRPLLFTITRNNTTKLCRIYVNGVFFEEVSYTTAPTGGTSAVFVLGHHPTISGNTSVQPVTYGHVSYFQRVLSDEEVRGMADAAGLLDVPAGVARFPVSNALNPTLNVLDQTVSKSLICAIDPLIDISVAFPDDAYSVGE